MTDKGGKLFDKCAVICVHLFPQAEECTSSSWEVSKIYTTGSITNSQRMLTERNKSGIITKISIWAETDTVKHWRL